MNMPRDTLELEQKTKWSPVRRSASIRGRRQGDMEVPNVRMDGGDNEDLWCWINAPINYSLDIYHGALPMPPFCSLAALPDTVIYRTRWTLWFPWCLFLCFPLHSERKMFSLFYLHSLLTWYIFIGTQLTRPNSSKPTTSKHSIISTKTKLICQFPRHIYFA